MARETGISWATSTFNPVMGCQEVSPACDHCYARTLVTGRMGLPVWGKDAERRVTGESYWKEPLKWQKEAEKTGVRPRVFCGSLCDVMEEHPAWVPVRPRLYDLIERTDMLDWLLVTKRPQNFRRFLPDRWLESMPRNVWGLTTVESPKYLWRIDALKSAPFSVRGLSIEPLLEDLPTIGEHLDGIDWVLVGGESGAGAETRPMHPDWARRIRDECLSRGIAFHFKQWGDWWPFTRVNGVHELPFGHYITALPEPFGFIRKGKKAAGHVLDGREWQEFPKERT